MKILKYLTSFGEDAIKPGSVLYILVYAVEKVLDAIKTAIDYMTDQIYLSTTTGIWLDMWGKDLAKLTRKVQESDEAFRARIILTLFRKKVIRKAIIQAVEIITGRPPVEIFEPIRDTAYWNARYFITPKQVDVSAANDASGVYAARMGTQEDTSYTGYVRVRLAADYTGGAGLSYFDAACFYDRGFYLSAVADKKRAITRKEVLDAVELIQAAGTEVKIEFIQ